MKLIGNKIHCKAIQTHLNRPYCGGFEGRRMMLKIAELTKPSMAMSMIAAVIRGRLYDRIEVVKLTPPTHKGSQLNRKIIRAFVGLEWVRSSWTRTKCHFLERLIFLFFVKPNMKYGLFSAP